MRVGIVRGLELSGTRRGRRGSAARMLGWAFALSCCALVSGTSGAAEREWGESDLVLGRSSRNLGRKAGAKALATGTAVGPRQTLRRALERTVVYWEPRRAPPRRAWVVEGSVFAVGREVEGPGCDTAWARVHGGGYVCLDTTEAADVDEPKLPAARPHRALPFLYAARAGNPAFSYAFADLQTDESGQRVLVRPGGRAHDASRYALHVPSAFRGRNLVRAPVPDGMLPAWAFVEDAPVFPAPSDVVEPAGRLRKHARVVVDAEPADEEGHWYRIPDGLGPGRPGYVDDRTAIRHWTPAPVVEDVAEHEVWIDIDLEQQVLAVRRGEDVIYVTLVSTGIRSRATPTGLYRIRDKRAWTSMGSRPTSEDRYFVEKVPWTMYFRDYYAIHGAYWHNIFGQQRSHGCINLAPRDAAYVYRVVSPRTERGFMWTYASDEAPGSTVRIRRGTSPVADYRD